MKKNFLSAFELLWIRKFWNERNLN